MAGLFEGILDSGDINESMFSKAFLNTNEQDSKKEDTSWKNREPHPPRKGTLCLCLTFFHELFS